MAGDPSVFSYAYAVTVDSGGNFVVVDSDSSPGLTPAELSVRVKDDVSDSSEDLHREIGDTANDHFHVSDAGGLNGEYTFTSVAMTADGIGSGGFIARDANGNYFYFTNTQVPDSQAGLPLTESEGPLQVCFVPGTIIATPRGGTAVEDLKIGDLVQTADGRAVTVRWIGRQAVAARFADALLLPIRVKAGALADNVPRRDLLVSPDHALLVDGILAHAGALVNGVSIVREGNVPAMFTYYHIETDDHSLILAEGASAETFIDNVDRMRFDNFAEYEALYPEERALVEMAYPRAKAYRQVPKATRSRLIDRAAALFGTVAVAA